MMGRRQAGVRGRLRAAVARGMRMGFWRRRCRGKNVVIHGGGLLGD